VRTESAAGWSAGVRVGGFAGLAACLPFIVTTWWYDFYYWPKVVVLYAALLVLTSIALLTDRNHWLRSLQSPVGVALVAWLGALIASTLLSVDPLLSLVGADYRYEGLWTWLAYGAIVAGVASSFVTTSRIRLCLAAILLAAAVMAVLGLLQHFGLSPVPTDLLRAGWTRAWGTTGNPLALGAYLVLLLPVAISFYVHDTRPGWRWVYGGLVVLLYAALLATRTRAAWGALAVGAAVWAAASGPGRLRAAARPLVLLAILLAAVTPAVLLTGPVTKPAGAVPLSSRGSADQRAFLWRTTAPLVFRRPLLGWGPETLAEVYPAYKSPEFPRLFPEAQMQTLVVDRPHNDLLQQALSSGLVGLGFYVWLWVTIFQTVVRTARAERIGWTSAGLSAGLLGGIVAYFCQLQLSFSYVSVAPVFWSLVGLVLALGRAPGSETTVRVE
jgi:putative inorganic carbon (HCO3(-)) transporter